MKSHKIILPIYNEAQKFASLGEKILKNGSVLIGRVPHVGQYAYLHEIYSPLKKNELIALEKRLNRKIPSCLLDFYSECNGLKYFSDVLSLDGCRISSGRSLEDAYQPYDLMDSNIHERIEDADEDIFFFGGYDWDGSRVYVRDEIDTIFFCGPDSVAPLKKWSDVKDFIREESARIAKLFDSNGIEKNSATSTLPI